MRISDWSSVVCSSDLLVFAVSRGACRRLFDDLPDPGGRWYLPSDLRALGQSIIAPECDAAAADTLRLARSIEMLCQFFAALRTGSLVAVEGRSEEHTSELQSLMRI